MCFHAWPLCDSMLFSHSHFVSMLMLKNYEHIIPRMAVSFDRSQLTSLKGRKIVLVDKHLQEHIKNLQSENQRLKSVIKPLVHLRHILLFLKHKFVDDKPHQDYSGWMIPGRIQQDLRLCLENYHKEIATAEWFKFVRDQENRYGSHLEYRDYGSVLGQFTNPVGFSNLATKRPDENSPPDGNNHEPQFKRRKNDSGKEECFFEVEMITEETVCETSKPAASAAQVSANSIIQTNNKTVRQILTKFDPSYRCLLQDCHFITTKAQGLEIHMKQNHPRDDSGKFLQFPCLFDNCDQIFTTSKRLESHLYTVHNAKNCCPRCNEKFLSLSSVIWHYQNHHQRGDYRCTAKGCHFRVEFRKDFTKHKYHKYSQLAEYLTNCPQPTSGYQTKFPQKQLENIPTHPCLFEQCDQIFSTSVNLNRHLDEVHMKNHYCQVCEKQFISHSKIRAHYRKKHRRRISKQMDTENDDKESENLEANTEIETADDSATEVAIPELNSAEETESIIRNKPEDQETTTLQLVNLTIQQSTPKPVKIKRRNPTRPGFTPAKIPCLFDQCDKDFPSFENLDEHQMEEHFGNCFCKGCEKEFNSQDNLIKHYRRIHERGVYKCPFHECNFTASFRKQIKDHRPVHFACPHQGCGLTFATKYKLKTHFETIHLRLKPNKCTWPGCGWATSNKQMLLVHARTHVNLKPYRCKWPDCSQRCNQRGSLLQHIRICHLKIPTTRKLQKQLNIPDELYDRANDFAETIPGDVEIQKSSSDTN